MRPSNTEAILSLRDVHKEFSDPAGTIKVLRGLSLSVHRGEIALLEGPSGSGKTTLLQIAGLMARATSGEVLLNGESLNEAPESLREQARRRHLGFVFQQFHLIDSLSVYDNVALSLSLRRMPVEKDRILRLLGGLGIEDKAAQRPVFLSGGQKQRVALARALVGRPSLLFADEPSSALDSESARTVCHLLRQAALDTGVAIVITTHDPRLRAIADRIHHLEEGRIHHESQESLIDERTDAGRSLALAGV